MFVSCAVVSVLLSATLVASGAAKLSRTGRVTEGLTGIGVPIGWFPWLATAEIAGGIGMVLGLAVPPLGVAATVGVVVYFVGASIAHVRVRDYGGIGAPAVLLVLAVAGLAFRLASL